MDKKWEKKVMMDAIEEIASRGCYEDANKLSLLIECADHYLTKDLVDEIYEEVRKELFYCYGIVL